MVKPISSDWFKDDQQFIWHPYSSFTNPLPVYPVESAKGVRIRLSNGQELIDGMASWWCVIHGYNHPVLNAALKQQIDSMSHVMFGGLTHEPAARLAAKLVELTPEPLQSVFFSDSGSVSIEVAMKMAIQYWQAKGQKTKQKFISFRQGYHGDTLGAMSVCDPVTGMHNLFNSILPKQFFVSAPQPAFGKNCSEGHLTEVRNTLEQHAEEIAALIIEPIVQGAGGMRFYSADYLSELREICTEYEVLLILDEIATGFGRTGKLFAAEHAEVSADILCLGKSLTGGYLTLAATLTTREIAECISRAEPGLFMHGPTFMANPLSCSVALVSIELLEQSNWQKNVQRIEQHLLSSLEICRNYDCVLDVRVLGAIGVIEMTRPVDMNKIVPKFVDAGIWVRPFGTLVYLMPAFLISNADLNYLTQSLIEILSSEDILLDEHQ